MRGERPRRFYSPSLWVFGSLLAAVCLWSRWTPPTSWSGLEDAGGPEEEGGKEGGREGVREGRRERDIQAHQWYEQSLVVNGHGWWTSYSRNAWSRVTVVTSRFSTQTHTASGWPWWYLILHKQHTHMHSSQVKSSHMVQFPSHLPIGYKSEPVHTWS